jgi:galactose mutarotase-like enzyme
METLSNEQLRIQVAPHGAELSSIVIAGKEYLWQADPAFWKRHSPVLFPIVGRVWEDEYRIGGQTFHLSQHGFARDMDFALLSKTDDEIHYVLTDNAESLSKYPFPFRLDIGYKIHGTTIDVMWEVQNTGTHDMPFQIGAHPAFYFPNFDGATEQRGFFGFDKKEGLHYILISEKGCADTNRTYPLTLDNGLLPLDTHTFDRDALIFENEQIHEVTLYDTNKRPYLTLRFDAPVVGLWSPPSKNAPFVCIEPWYGRCDRVHYQGDFDKKDWIQHLPKGKIFKGGYSIEIRK